MKKLIYSAPEFEVVSLEETDIVLISIDDTNNSHDLPTIDW